MANFCYYSTKKIEIFVILKHYAIYQNPRVPYLNEAVVEIKQAVTIAFAIVKYARILSC